MNQPLLALGFQSGTPPPGIPQQLAVLVEVPSAPCAVPCGPSAMKPVAAGVQKGASQCQKNTKKNIKTKLTFGDGCLMVMVWGWYGDGMGMVWGWCIIGFTTL